MKKAPSVAQNTRRPTVLKPAKASSSPEFFKDDGSDHRQEGSAFWQLFLPKGRDFARKKIDVIAADGGVKAFSQSVISAISPPFD